MTILTTVLELIADILRSLLSNICHHVFQRKSVDGQERSPDETIYDDMATESAHHIVTPLRINVPHLDINADRESLSSINLYAGSLHAIDSASRLPRTPLSKSEQRVVFEEIRRIALELTTKEINDLGPAVEEFFPYLTFEEILAIKHSELTPSSPSSSWLERLLNVSDSTLQQPSPASLSNSIVADPSYAEDSYGLSTATHLAAAILDSNDDRFLQFAEAELRNARLFVNESLRQDAFERIMLVKAAKALEQTPIRESNVTARSDEGTPFAAANGFSEIENSFDEPPIDQSSPQCEGCGGRYEIRKDYWKAVFSPLSSASDESSKRTFHASKNSFDMESVPKLSESDDRETRENYNEDTDLLNETDINRNLLAVFNISPSYFD
ncbi:hypothetical protein Tcan_16584 [Toxocara canis]|uniref:Uncharacterized protein n=1 Tax=Toxocara canis TaxID=6265 RepID=A0A0B2V9C1_TOXCA|nr:hypothetical protein Tcan_16584 [Toxocara canis]